MQHWLGLALMVCAPQVAAQEFFTLKGHGGPIMDITVHPQTGQIATASFDNSVGLWQDVSPSWLEEHRAAVNTVLFTKDGNLISGGDDFALVAWDGTVPTRHEGHKGKVMALAQSNDGSVIASASWDGSIGLWRDGGVAFLNGHDSGVNDVTFSPDGSRLYSASSDGTIREWDVVAGVEKRMVLRHGFGINELVLHPEGKWLAYGAVDGVTRVIDPQSADQIVDVTLDRRPILSMAAHFESDLLAVGDGEGFIMVLDTTTWKVAKDFKATIRGPIWALAFSNNGQNIHAGGIEDILYSWPVETMGSSPQMSGEGRSFLVDPETVPNGERQFKRKCSVCHTLSPSSARRAGPTLHKLFGRAAGTVSDYSYSATLSNSQIIWTDETIDGLFDLGPDHFIPGTKMPMQRIVKPQDRTDLIDYLRVATDP